MEEHRENPAAAPASRMGGHVARNLLFVVLGVVGLLVVYWYSGPFFNVVHSYGGNVAASFAFYFIVRPAVARVRWSRAASVFVAVLVAEVFEATDGFFGVMTNVYDPLDYLVNALGVGLAAAVDVLAAYVSRGREGGKAEVQEDDPRAI